MPRSAIANVEVDHVAFVDDIAGLLVDLVGERGEVPSGPSGDQAEGDSQERGMTAEFSVNRPVAVTCPDCGGALKRRELGTLTQFSCNIGDVYIVGVIVAAQFLALERFVEQAMRSLSERAELCRIMMDKAGNGEAVEPTQWEDAMAEALDHTAGLVRPGDGAGAHGAPLRDGMVHGGDVIRDCWGRITGPEKAAW